MRSIPIRLSSRSLRDGFSDDRSEALAVKTVDDVVDLAKRYWGDPRAVATSIRSEDHALSASDEIRTVAVYYWQLGCGGADEVARTQLKTLAALGFNTILITDNPVPQGTLDELGNPPHCLLATSQGMRPEEYVQRANAFDRCLVDNRVDALIYNQWLCDTALWEMLIAKLHSIPVAVCMHGVYSFPLIELWKTTNFAKRLVELPSTLSLADAIICASTADKAFWSRRNPNVFLTCYKSPFALDASEENRKAAGQSALDPNATDSKCEDATASAPRIIWIGRIAEEKRPLDAVRILAKVKQRVPDAVLDMVGPGEGDWAELVRQEADNLEVSDSVIMHGGQSDVARFYEKASLYLHTSATESYCLSLLEAKSWGLPCVMYELPFLELAKNGIRGGVESVAHRDVDAAANACASILENPQLRIKLGKAAQDDVAPILRFEETAFWKEVLDSFRQERVLPALSEGDSLADDAFRIAYTNAIDDLRARIQVLERRATEAEASLNEIRSSTTFKAGKILLGIPTRIKDAIRARR